MHEAVVDLSRKQRQQLPSELVKPVGGVEYVQIQPFGEFPREV
jgi:hypothetical protein